MGDERYLGTPDRREDFDVVRRNRAPSNLEFGASRAKTNARRRSLWPCTKEFGIRSRPAKENLMAVVVPRIHGPSRLEFGAALKRENAKTLFVVAVHREV
jgi:hypothetical protein